MIKYLFLTLLLFSQVFAKEYPPIYTQLATPLFSSSSNILKLSNIASLENICLDYVTHSNEVLAYAKTIDTTDVEATSRYLHKLRGLEKEYNYTLHSINQAIKISINRDDYSEFLLLVESDLDGLLKGKALLSSSMKYYETNKAEKKSKYLDEKLEFIKLLKSSEEEMYNQSIKDNLNSLNKKPTNKKVYLEAIENDKYIAINIINKKAYSITMEIDAVYTKLNQDTNRSKSFVVKPKTKLEYIRLYKKEESYSYSVNYNWILGSKDAVHDDTYLYRLPYKSGTSEMVSQGYKGKHSHYGKNKYAVDFALKMGTGVYAARDGIVVASKSNSNIGGSGRKFSSQGNYVKILHSDGTFAIYYHLKMNGVLVKLGQKVLRGDRIGLSGNTGNSTGPHLHFSVYKAENARTTKTLQIKFISEKGLLSEPKIGTSYKAK